MTVTTARAERSHQTAGIRVLPGSRHSDLRRILLLVLGLVIASLPLGLFAGSVAGMAALHTLVVPGGGWLPAASILPAALATLEVAGALALLFAPGLLLALAFNRARTVSAWVLHAFALNLIVISAAAALTQFLLGEPLRRAGFVMVVACCIGAALAVLVMRSMRRPLSWPELNRSALGTLACMYGFPLVLLGLLAPKFFWEAFNGDGAHAYETARLLLHQTVPFWNADAGVIAGFPGTTSFLFAYPASWFVRLFGELEVSARLPLVMYLPVLAAALFALIDLGRTRATNVLDGSLVWLAITTYVVVIAFSATYSPYSADIALPATQDTLVVIAFLGFALAFFERSYGAAFMWALLACASLPNGILLIAFLLGGRLMAQQPRPWPHVLGGGATLFTAVAVLSVLPFMLVLAGAPAPGAEYGAGGLITRFAFLQVTDVARLTYLLVPCGILPALSLLFWKRQDPLSRTFTLTTAAYFLFAFVQAHAPLHYYIPAMVLPLIVYWRALPQDAARRNRWRAATAVCGIAALWLSWPVEPGPYTASRDVGGSIDVRVPGYATMRPAPLAASSLIEHVLPLDWDPAVPQSSFGGSPLAFQYYAHTNNDESINYVLQPAATAPPPGAREVATADGFTLFVLEDEVWRSHLALRPASPPGARIYQQKRSILFRSVPHEGHPWIINLPALVARTGVDVDRIARRMGVDR